MQKSFEILLIGLKFFQPGRRRSEGLLAENGLTWHHSSRYHYIMSFRQRAAPLMIAGLVGVGSGIYIFDPIMKAYFGEGRPIPAIRVDQHEQEGGVGGAIDPQKVKDIADGAQSEAKRILKGDSKDK